MFSKAFYKFIWSFTLIIDIEQAYNFTTFPQSLPISPVYSISAAWNDHLYLLNGKIGNNSTNSVDTYNLGLYSFDLSTLSTTRTNNDTSITLQNINQTDWIYTSNQVPNNIKYYQSGIFTSWQSYTQINHLIYALSPDTPTPSDENKYMLIYDLSVPGWVDAKTYQMPGNFAVCATNNDTHIFGIGVSNESSSSSSSSSSNVYSEIGYSIIYDIKNDIWATTSSMSISIHSTGCAYSHTTNKVYSFGGAITTRDVKTDIILKYNIDNNKWTFAENNLPNPMMNLFCYELLLSDNIGIYCMNGVGSIDVYPYIMKFDVETEIISIIDQYVLPIHKQYLTVNAFMSSFVLNQNEQYALMYVMGGEIHHSDTSSEDDIESNQIYISQIQYKAFIGPVPTERPTENPNTFKPTTNPSKSPTNYPSDLPTTYPSESPTNYPSKSPTNYPSTSPTNYPSNLPTTYEPTTILTTEQTTLEPSVLSTVEISTAFPTDNPSKLLTSNPTDATTTLITSEEPTTNPITSTNIPSEMETINPTGMPLSTNVPSITPTVTIPKNRTSSTDVISVISTTETTGPPITPQNYFGTMMGKSVLFVIGFAGLAVVIGLIIYFKSNDGKIKQSPMFRHKSSTDPYMYLINDTETFSL